MTRLIPRVMLLMMTISLLFIATAAANMAPDPDWGWTPSSHFSNRYDYYDYVIERIQSHFRYPQGVRDIPYDSRVAQILRGNTSGTADVYNSDRLQDLINDIRTRM